MKQVVIQLHDKPTTIQLTNQLKKRLDEMKVHPRETYADVILSLINIKLSKILPEVIAEEPRRKAALERITKETQISLDLAVDGVGKSEISTPIGFLTHMLENFAKHGLFDLRINANGDLYVDQHHLVEDLGIALGQAFKKALGDKKGINRAGFFAFPMDDCLSIVSLDINGRPASLFKTEFEESSCGKLDTCNVKSFFSGFSIGLGANVIVITPILGDIHHQIESIFKAFGKAMKMACSKDKRALKEIPSTKGLIEI